MTDAQRAALDELDANIRQGESLADDGFDCDALLRITKALRRNLIREIKNDEAGQFI